MSLSPNIIAFLILGLINLVAFLIMMFDKIRSRKANATRISEGAMFFMSTCFGSIGVYLGMFVFHHKTKKWYFLIGIPLSMLQNAASLYLIYQLYWQELATFISFDI